MDEKTKIWYLQNFNLIKGMDESSMEMMDQKSKMKKSSKKLELVQESYLQEHQLLVLLKKYLINFSC